MNAKQTQTKLTNRETCIQMIRKYKHALFIPHPQCFSSVFLRCHSFVFVCGHMHVYSMNTVDTSMTYIKQLSFQKCRKRNVGSGVKGRKQVDKCVCMCVFPFALYFVMTNGSYVFLLKLFLNTNEVIYLQKPPLIQSWDYYSTAYFTLACGSLQIPSSPSSAI